MGNVCSQIRDSIVVSISACHADDPGSIPGRGVLCMLNAIGLEPLYEVDFDLHGKALWPNG
jgi:hypothetical protein